MNKLKDKTSNVLAIIRSDIKRLSKSVVAIVCVFGLALIPCLYAWFNIISNWDPYTPDSTKNLTIAVASEDEGTTFVGLDLNVGNIIIESSKATTRSTGSLSIPSRRCRTACTAAITTPVSSSPPISVILCSALPTASLKRPKSSTTITRR